MTTFTCEGGRTVASSLSAACGNERESNKSTRLPPHNTVSKRRKARTDFQHCALLP